MRNINGVPENKSTNCFCVLHLSSTKTITSLFSADLLTQILTPANTQVDFEVVPLGEDSDDQEVVEVDAFHQKPVAVGHDAVLHHHHCHATTNPCLQDGGGGCLQNTSSRRTLIMSCSAKIREIL